VRRQPWHDRAHVSVLRTCDELPCHALVVERGCPVVDAGGRPDLVARTTECRCACRAQWLAAAATPGTRQREQPVEHPRTVRRGYDPHSFGRIASRNWSHLPML
jgi:hypothetical protein